MTTTLTPVVLKQTLYTAITFAPVQGFIEQSRKLRDLYGSSYLLSFLAKVICLAADSENLIVISPASPNIIQGLPNVIIIQGELSKEKTRQWFDIAWNCIANTCKDWIQAEVEEAAWKYRWDRSWSAWGKHAWELFWVTYTAPAGTTTGEAVQTLYRNLTNAKRARNWTGINWHGESSTLTGTDSIAHPEMEIAHSPQYDKDRYTPILKDFHRQLRIKLGEQFMQLAKIPLRQDELAEHQYLNHGNVFVDEREELSIPDLVKRLITHKAVIQTLKQKMPAAFQPLLENDRHTAEELKKLLQELENRVTQDLNHKSFRDLNRLPKNNEPTYWTGWFMGDGDSAGKYLRKCESAEAIQTFSGQMRTWGYTLKAQQDKYLNNKGCMIYAGGDDFLGVLYDADNPLPEKFCINWLLDFKPHLWNSINGPKPITTSVGFVWVSPQVPQRDLLQHCREAEKDAKTAGRDRLALRIVFANGNTLQWICPWRFLPVLSDYRDRTQTAQSWTHLFNDIAVLESRHAFSPDSPDVAKSIFRLYFKPRDSMDTADQTCFYQLFCEDTNLDFTKRDWWNLYLHHGQETHDGELDGAKLTVTGLLGDRNRYIEDHTANGTLNLKTVHTAVNNWVINLAKVGFQLCQSR
jgi:CRISPR-associated protein Cmr2